jgi:TRAP-type C4-dicarboxylate transport system substrate-binding protein
VKVKVFLSGVMGGEVEMVRDIAEGGRLQGGGFSTAAVATGANVPALQLPELPFLFRSDAEADHILDNVLFEPMQKKLKRRQLYLAMWSVNGWRSFYTKNSAIQNVEQLKAHKMRVQESDVHKAMYKALGVQAVALPTPEVLDALTRGTVDGFDNTSLFGQASGWFEPTKYYTLSRHIFQPAAIIYGKDFIEALPEDLQTVVLGDRLAEQKKGRDLVRGLEGELINNFKELGITVVEPTEAELKPFIDATKSVHDEFRDQFKVGKDGNLLNDVEAELKKLRG